MTDQLQNTRDPWTPPAPTLEQADPDWTGPASSTQDSRTRDRTDQERPAEDGTVYESAAHESAVDEPVVEEPRVDGTAADEAAVGGNIAEQPMGDGDGFDTVDTSVPAGDAGFDHADPGHAVGVASVPDAEAEAGSVDPDEFDAPGVAAHGAVETDGADGAYGTDGQPADAAAAPEESEEPEAAEEPDGAATVTEIGQRVDDVDERGDVVGGESPIVPAPGDDVAAPDVTGSGQLVPGDVPDEPNVALFDAEMTDQFRDRWQRLQMDFVDDPQTAVGLAGALVDEVVTALREAVDRQRSALEEWHSGHGVDAHAADTERLRVAVRRYRDFLDRLLSL
jgi:hypothetical protein